MSKDPPDAVSEQYGGLLRRLAALSYDVLLVTSVMMLLTLALLPLSGGQPIEPGNAFYQILLFVAVGCFFIGFWVYGGQTLGMRAWRLKVVQNSGEPLTWKIGLIRFISGFLSLLPLGLGVIWIAIDPEKQAWHDKIAGTRAIQTLAR